LDVQVPPGWRAGDREEFFNRASLRLALIANGPLPASPDPYRYLTLESTMALEILEFVGPAAGIGGFEEDSVFPLDWSKARPASDPSGDPVMLLTFRHVARSLAIRAHISALSSERDRDLISEIVASIRPDPIPTSGAYQRWESLGPVSTFPIGAVRHYDRPANEVGGYFIVRGMQHVFALIDKGYLMIGSHEPCPVRYDASARLFVCDATGDTWDRTGAVVKGQGPFGLARHPIGTKDGIVLVNPLTAIGGGQPATELIEFPDPVSH
jgi:hypothetical protein